MNIQTLPQSDELCNQQSSLTIVGDSDMMQRVYTRINQVKDLDTCVLITGESGTGKELVARAIHDAGKRKNERFMVVNCSATSDSFLELELFGHCRGAIPGADYDRKGKLDLVDNGTLYLDEIGSMSPNLQGKLLRVLEGKGYSPVGSTEVHHPKMRVIASTSKDLQVMADHQTFRQDLYYRLNVIEITMPALRERMADIPLLCDHFLVQNATKLNGVRKTLTEAAQEALMGYSFPGNIRQLACFLEYAAIVSPGEVIDVSDLPAEITGCTDDLRSPAAVLEHFLASTNLKELERLTIAATLKKNNGRRDKTATSLGISKRSLLNKIHEHGIG